MARSKLVKIAYCAYYRSRCRVSDYRTIGPMGFFIIWARPPPWSCVLDSVLIQWRLYKKFGVPCSIRENKYIFENSGRIPFE